MKTKSLLVITSLITLALAGVLSYGIYQISAESKQASAMQNQADALTNANNLAQSIRDTRTRAATDLAAFDALTLTQDKLVPFIELIEKTGKTLGVTVDISSVTGDTGKPVASTTDTGVPQPVHIAIDTEGSWSASLGFIHALESLPQRVTIDGTTMTASSVSSDPDALAAPSSSVSSNKWHTTSTITVYSFKQ